MQSSDKPHNALTLILVWIIWILASLTYFHQYFLRQIVSSLSCYLMNDFFLTAVNLTDLDAIFFVAYVLILPLSGILIDHYGIKRMLPLALTAAAISCFLFYAAKTGFGLIIARLLMGASATFTLLSAYTVIRQYFPAKLFPLLSGLTLTIGVIGAIFGSFFLVAASEVINWRDLMCYAGLFALGIALFFYISVHTYDRKKTRHNPTQTISLKQFFINIRFFLQQKANWLPGLYGGFILTPIIAFASFWAAPFLGLHYQVSALAANYFITYLFVGYAIGAPVLALISQKKGLKPTMIFTASLATCMLTLITFCTLNQLFLISCLFLLGFTAGGFGLTTILIKMSVPGNITASAFSFNTMIAQLIGASILWAMGQIIYYSHGVQLMQKQQIYSAKALSLTMCLLILTSLLGVITAAFIRTPTEKKSSIK